MLNNVIAYSVKQIPDYYVSPSNEGRHIALV
jgi:hypothetical protein